MNVFTLMSNEESLSYYDLIIHYWVYLIVLSLETMILFFSDQCTK